MGPDGNQTLAHWGWIDNPNFNALAFLEDGNGFVGIYRGVLETLVDLIAMAVFEELDEKVHPTISSAVRSMEDRQSAVTNIVVLAIDFVFLHEFTHLKHGHVGLLEARTAETMLVEFSRRGPKTAASDLQALESDADHESAWIAARQMTLRPMRAASTRDEFALIPYAEDLRSVVAINWLAIYLTLLAFDDNDWRERNWRDRSHPPAAIRMFSCFRTVVGYLIMNDAGVDEEDLAVLLSEGVSLAERSFLRRAGHGVGSMSILGLSDEESSHDSVCRDRRRVLYPMLEPFRRCAVLPPAPEPEA